MIYSILFLYALLNCISFYCNFIGQVDIRKTFRLHDCNRLRNRKGRILLSSMTKYFLY